MRPYAPENNIGRTIAMDDVLHRTADATKKAAKKAAKPLKHAARQQGKRMAIAEIN